MRGAQAICLSALTRRRVYMDGNPIKQFKPDSVN